MNLNNEAFEEVYGCSVEDCFHIHKPFHKKFLLFLLDKKIDYRIVTESSSSCMIYVPNERDRTFVLLAYK